MLNSKQRSVVNRSCKELGAATRHVPGYDGLPSSWAHNVNFIIGHLGICNSRSKPLCQIQIHLGHDQWCRSAVEVACQMVTVTSQQGKAAHVKGQHASREVGCIFLLGLVPAIYCFLQERLP